MHCDASVISDVILWRVELLPNCAIADEMSDEVLAEDAHCMDSSTPHDDGENEVCRNVINIREAYKLFKKLAETQKQDKLVTKSPEEEELVTKPLEEEELVTKPLEAEVKEDFEHVIDDVISERCQLKVGHL